MTTERRAPGSGRRWSDVHDSSTPRELLEAQNRELREMQLALEESRERCADLYDFGPVGYLTMDRVGNVVEMNLTAAGLLGVDRPHLVGQPLTPHVAAGASSAFFQHLRRVVDLGERDYTELRMHRPGGAEFDAFLESIPERSGNEAPGRCRTALMDITERKRGETALARGQQLVQANAELRQFSHILSHDLKAPLRAISNLAVVLEEDFGEGFAPEARGYLLKLRTRAEKADALIERVLAFFSADNPEAAEEPVDVPALVREIVTALGMKECFRVEIGEALPTLETERLPLRQTFANLISNAVEHHDRECGTIRVDASRHRGVWEFTVEDDGPGIPPELQEQVFEMFRSFGSSHGPSSGMGLGLVRKLVFSRGGHIHVESDPPRRGTTFRFTWPKRER